MTALEAVTGLVMLVGLVGIVVPLVPGSILIWLATVVWAVAGDGPPAIRWTVAAVATAVLGLGMYLSMTMPARAAAGATTPAWLPWFVALGMIVGFFVVPIVGALVGGPVAAFLAESVRLRDAGAGWRSALHALRGYGVGVAIELSGGVLVIAIWAATVVTTS